jgi:hypothetical protein
VSFDHHSHIIKRRRRRHAGNGEHLGERLDPIWPRSRPAVEAFAAARILLLLLCLRRLERRELVLRIEVVFTFLPAVVDWVRIIRIRV